MDRLLLVISTFFFLLGFAYTMFALGAGMHKPSRFNFTTIFCGFTLQTVFLFERGHALGRCPLTNLFEVLIFLSWSVVLFYLVVGPAYRLSLMGAFTSPLVFLFQSVALLAPIDTPAKLSLAPNRWLELHAAISVVAYGAFALAGVAGVMYLAQERQLKTRHLHPLFYHLPPIANLQIAVQRLLTVGLALLTIGVLAGFAIGRPLDWVKVGWSLAVWVGYALIIEAGKHNRVGPRGVAALSVGAFSLTLTTLFGLNFL